MGETSRTLSVRIDEHLAGKKLERLLSPLGKHRNDARNGDDFEVKCTILTHERDLGKEIARSVLDICKEYSDKQQKRVLIHNC